MYRKPREDNGCGLLVEAALNRANVIGVGVPRAAEGGRTESNLAAGVLVFGEELDEPSLVGWEGILL